VLDVVTWLETTVPRKGRDIFLLSLRWRVGRFLDQLVLQALRSRDAQDYFTCTLVLGASQDDVAKLQQREGGVNCNIHGIERGCHIDIVTAAFRSEQLAPIMGGDHADTHAYLVGGN
jgi:hypothetical protein